EDESLLVQNAYLTAEGALSEIIRLTDFSLLGAKVLVIGNGRVGKAVSKILRNIGADVTVSARKTSDFAKIKTEGMKFIHTEKISKTIGAFNIVINTVPAPVLGEKQLAKMKDKAVIFDLAPNTDGVEKDAVNKYKIRYVPLPGLPGIYSPKTAGEVLCKTVVSLTEGGN
ncbi:MAG: NAD(P)-dependent oxidoreductase, partial [Acutalibacteraceae bacterium]